VSEHAESPKTAGIILAVASVVPAVVAAAWVAVALPLLVFHIYRPLPAIVLGVGLAVVLARPAISLSIEAARRMGDVPWWALVAVFVVVFAFGALAFVHSAQDVLVRRDPGSYAMSATWLTHHGTVDMPIHAQLYGAPNSHLLLASQGFYRQGSHDIPQFMTGVPALLAVGGWIDGLKGVFHGNAIIGSFALLAFAGLIARLVDARWAAVGVLVLGLLQPELDVMRATYSEPAAQLILLGGLAVVLDALVVGRMLAVRRVGFALTPADTPAEPANDRFAAIAGRGLFVGGLVLGLVFVVRVDAVADLFPLVPFVGWLAYHRVAAWRPLTYGLLLGLALGGLDCVVLTLPYAEHVGSDLLIVGVGFFVLVPATFVGVLIARRLRRNDAAAEGWAPNWLAALRRPKWQAWAAVVGVFLIGMFFFLRPHLMTLRSSPTSGGANYVGQVQRFLHMPFDPTRSYYEHATVWLSWYFGWGTLALALAGACWLAYEQVIGRRRVWMPAFLVFFGTTAAVLLRPSITPDHPWADRRFVPVVLPGLLLFAIAVIAVGLQWLGQRGWVGTVRASSARLDSMWAAQAAVCVALLAVLVLPAWTGSRQVFYSKTEQGEPALVATVCKQLRPGDVVLAIGNRAKTEWPGTLRVLCGVDAGYLDGADDATQMAAINAKVVADGGRLMLLAESTADKDAAASEAAWPATHTGYLITSEVTHTLVTRPGKPTVFATEMWLGQYLPSGA
jgi:hypothetical protein